MNTREMLIEFERQVEAIYPNFDVKVREQMTTDSIMYFINLAEDTYLKENFLSKAQIKDSVEYIKKRADVLRKLITREADKTVDSTYTPDLNDGGITISLPTDYLFYMNSYSKVLRSDEYQETTYAWTPNRLIGHDELDRVVTNPINKPILRQPAILLEGDDKLIVYKDQYTTINNFEITYIREPKKLVLGTPSANETNTSELAEHTHIEIVRKAAMMFIEEYKFKLNRAQ